MRVVFSQRADKANIRVGLRGRGVGEVGERLAGVGGGGGGRGGAGALSFLVCVHARLDRRFKCADRLLVL